MGPCEATRGRRLLTGLSGGVSGLRRLGVTHLGACGSALCRAPLPGAAAAVSDLNAHRACGRLAATVRATAAVLDQAEVRARWLAWVTMR